MFFTKNFLLKCFAAPLLLVFAIYIGNNSLSGEEEIIIDSKMTFDEAMKGTKAPKNVIESQELLTVRYYSIDGKIHEGQLVVHKDLAGEVAKIFEIMLEKKFTVEKCIPIVYYDWSDRASMEDNNTSAFNYRFISGTKRLSNHAFGRAVDINPRLNPYVRKNGSFSPSNGEYDINTPGTFTNSGPIVKEFKKRGWRWGGNFRSVKDYHHFDKK